MNTKLVESALSAHGRRLVVLDASEADDGLVRDLIAALTSSCAWLVGRQSARNRAINRWVARSAMSGLGRLVSGRAACQWSGG